MLAVQQTGSTEIIRILLRCGADINAQNKDGETALIKAISKRDYFSGHLNIIRFLLEADANLELVDSQGITALMKAVNRGQPDVVKLLLERKANPNIQDKMGNNLIILAIKAIDSCLEFLRYTGKQSSIDNKEADAYYAIIKLLLEFGCNSDMQNSHGFTALTMAVIKNDFKSAKILLKKRCSPDVQTKFGNTALDYAKSTNNHKLINLLLKYNASQTNKEVKEARTLSIAELKIDTACMLSYDLKPLIAYAKEGNISLIKRILDNNSNNSIPMQDFGTALYYAIHMKHKEVVKILLDYVINNCIDINDTLLCTAISSGEAEVVKMLLEYKADPNKPDEYDNYPLIRAAEMNNFEMIKLLTEHGANVNIMSTNGSALMHAGERGNIDIVRFLLDNGAYPYIQATGESLLTKIANNGYVNIAKLLIQRKININLYKEFTRCSPLLLAVQSGHAEYVDLLLAQGANPDAIDLFDCSALMHAAKNGNIKIVKSLLDYGATIDLLDGQKQTAQKYAEEYGHMDIKELLSNNTESFKDVSEIIMAPIKKFLIT